MVIYLRRYPKIQNNWKSAQSSGSEKHTHSYTSHVGLFSEVRNEEMWAKNINNLRVHQLQAKVIKEGATCIRYFVITSSPGGTPTF
jgi:hypothetical protein